MPCDAPDLLRIWCAAVDATHDFLDPVDRVLIEDDVAEMLEATSVRVAFGNDGQSLGFALLADDGHMEALYVDPAAHGRGVGRMLVEEALEVFPALTLDVNEQNPMACGFYRHLGFRQVGVSANDGSGRPYPLLHLKFGG